MKDKKTKLVKNFILSNIKSGVYRTGQMIDSEPQLVGKLGISRVTVREAIRELVEEKFLERQHGRGTFVLEQPKFKEFQCGIGFSKEMLRCNMKPSSKFVNVTEIEADASIIKDLKLSSETSVWYVSRLRLADNQPIAVEHEYFSKSIIPYLSIQIAQGSIYEYLTSQNLEYSYIDQKIDAILAQNDIAKLLNVKNNTPLIRMYIIAYLKNGTPFNCGTTYYLTDVFKLSQTVYKR